MGCVRSAVKRGSAADRPRILTTNEHGIPDGDLDHG
jgi:hypothetical protein